MTKFLHSFSIISTTSSQPILLKIEGHGEDTPHPHNSTKVPITTITAVVVAVAVVGVVAWNPMREFLSVLKVITGPGSHGPTVTSPWGPGLGQGGRTALGGTGSALQTVKARTIYSFIVINIACCNDDN